MSSEVRWNSRKPNIRKVSPLRCRMWDMHDRLGEQIDERSCTALVESIEAHGQRHPVLGRSICDADGYDVELIYGARRLFVARHLGLELLVDVQDIENRDAVIEMFVENRGRKDISPYERGLSYARMLRTGVFKNQCEMARALGASEAQISRLLRYAELPVAVVRAFQSGCDIREEWAATLAKLCADSPSRDVLLRHAREYTAAARREAPQCVYDALVNGAAPKLVKYRRRDEVVKDSKGHPAARLQFRSKSVHVVLPRSNLETSVLYSAVRAMVSVLEDARPERSASVPEERIAARPRIVGAAG